MRGAILNLYLGAPGNTPKQGKSVNFLDISPPGSQTFVLYGQEYEKEM
jgi:hypothetical protein